MIRAIDDLDKITEGETVVLLFSGGLDSTYLLTKLINQHNCYVIALTIDVGQTDSPIDLEKQNRVEFVKLDCREEFSYDYVLSAIQNNGRYLGHHPLSASLSRPLFAKKAIELARDRGACAIIHTAVAHQNSLRRFNNSIKELGFEGEYGSPFELSDVSRKEKIEYLKEYSVDVCQGRKLSFDSNLWAMECEGDGPDCKSIKEYPHEFLNFNENRFGNIDIVLEFSKGVPVSLNHQEMKLNKLIESLTELVKDFEIGQYISYEENPSNEKMLEIKKAPAAEIILKSYWSFLNKFLAHDHLMLKNQLDQVWSKEASEGRWYSNLKKDIEAFNRSISKDVNCVVSIKVSSSKIHIVNVEKTIILPLQAVS